MKCRKGHVSIKPWLFCPCREMGRGSQRKETCIGLMVLPLLRRPVSASLRQNVVLGHSHFGTTFQWFQWYFGFRKIHCSASWWPDREDHSFCGGTDLKMCQIYSFVSTWFLVVHDIWRAWTLKAHFCRSSGHFSTDKNCSFKLETCGKILTEAISKAFHMTFTNTCRNPLWGFWILSLSFFPLGGGVFSALTLSNPTLSFSYYFCSGSFKKVVVRLKRTRVWKLGAVLLCWLWLCFFFVLLFVRVHEWFLAWLFRLLNCCLLGGGWHRPTKTHTKQQKTTRMSFNTLPCFCWLSFFLYQKSIFVLDFVSLSFVNDMSLLCLDLVCFFQNTSFAQIEGCTCFLQNDHKLLFCCRLPTWGLFMQKPLCSSIYSTTIIMLTFKS